MTPSINIQPITSEPVLVEKNTKTVIIADLHIGIELELREQGLHIPSQTETLLSRVITLCKKIKPKQIVLLGDIKHTIPIIPTQERRDVRRFLETIQTYGQVHIFPGNHDGNLNRITPSETIIHPSNGSIIENIGFIHGHRWPTKEILQCKTLILAHTHPTVMLQDRLGIKHYEPCWLKGTLIQNKIKERYQLTKSPQTFIMPAFNPLCGGIAVNTDQIIGPFAKLINLPKTEVYLLDGSLLGTVNSLK